MNPRNVAIPTSFFGMVLGLVGLGNAWRVAVKLWNLPAWTGEGVMLLALTVWALLALLYVAKWIWHREDAVAEMNHPVQCCFIGLAPVSTALIALAVIPYSRPAAIGIFVAGAIGTVAFSVGPDGVI